jgi:hypothetical protein
VRAAQSGSNLEKSVEMGSADDDIRSVAHQKRMCGCVNRIGPHRAGFGPDAHSRSDCGYRFWPNRDQWNGTCAQVVALIATNHRRYRCLHFPVSAWLHRVDSRVASRHGHSRSAVPLARLSPAIASLARTVSKST